MAVDIKTPTCYLLELPAELQLDIYELAVAEDYPLLINCPCNSSYRGRPRDENIDEEQWKNREKLPPKQPALTQTCRSIRDKALPIFYKENVFRAAYCHAAVSDSSSAIKWLQNIGKQNREALRHFYFYDRNHRQDSNSRRTLQNLKDCEIFTELGGKMETLNSEFCCAHLVTFGEQLKRTSPLASVLGVPRLRTEGEL